MKQDRITFRTEKKLKEKIKRESKKSNLSMSEYINRQLKNKNIVVIECGKEIFFELNKIGNNLNQIARKLNTDNSTFRDSMNIKNIDNNLEKIWQLLNTLK